jgi:DNA-directed RNA polymerase subunit RPC12/RpoP
MKRPHVADPGTLFHAYCHRCERWRVLEADVFTVDFSIDTEAPTVATCPACGEQGLVKARLPATRAPQPALMLALEEMPDERWRIYC